MAPRKKKANASESSKEEADYDCHSIELMLENVNEFIEGVYRDLNMRPTHLNASSSRNITYTPIRSTTICNTSSSSNSPTSSIGAIGGALSPISNDCGVSPTENRNMDAEIDRTNMCENADQNLRSNEVLIINSPTTGSSKENLSNSGANPPTPLTPSLGDLVTSTLLPMTERQTTRGVDVESRTIVDVSNVIDLSDTLTQTPEVLRQQHYRLNNDDDDVILVSDNMNPIVDLCTPGNREPTTRRSSISNRSQSRRRLEQYIHELCEPISTRNRCTESPILIACSSTITSAQTANSDIPPTLGPPGPTPFMCAVCMESCLQRQPTSTKCGHVFCQECITQAIRLTHKCPLCNTKITNTQIFRIYL